ncbi:MAG: carboxyl-terminal processing protease [Mycobacteriales bacterium]
MRVLVVEDDEELMLVPAFAGLIQELQRRGLDQAMAAMPPLSGDKDADLAAFTRVYRRITAGLPDDAAVRQAVADATIRGMIGALNDNHVAWRHGLHRSAQYNIGLSAINGADSHLDPVAAAPLYVTEVGKGSPADKAGVRQGDEITAINGVPPYVNGVLSTGVLDWLTDSPDGSPVSLTLHRPVTGATLTATVPAGPPAPPDLSSPARLVDGDIGYVQLAGFNTDMVGKVLAGIAELRKGTELRGVVLDLRGNGGGDADAVTALLSSFVHDKTFGYWCDARDNCTANRTDDSVPLLHLPLVVLTDHRCASACDAFSNAVKDLHVGKLVGTRTSGIVSGPADPFMLDDGSTLQLPVFYGLGPNREVINTIGVAADYNAPLTAADLSAGRDPGLDKAVTLLH